MPDIILLYLSRQVLPLLSLMVIKFGKGHGRNTADGWHS